MALDKKELNIVETDKEDGRIPYFLIDDEYGVANDENNEMLVQKKLSTRTIKDDGEPYIEQYYKWDVLSYVRTFYDVIECYKRRKTKTEFRKLTKSKDFKDLIKIEEETKDIISKSLESSGVNQEFLSVASLIDEKAKLQKEIETLREMKNQVLKESESLLELIKQKRTIIISNTEEKKRRLKLDE